MSAKTKYPTAIAEEICGMRAKSKRIPQKIREMFLKIGNDLEAGEY